MQKRFADIPSVQKYVDTVLALEAVRERYPERRPGSCRERRGQGRAHYEPSTSTVAIPLENRVFDRASTVLHELAHHLSVSEGLPVTRSRVRWHGVEFRRDDLRGWRRVGETAALLLRAGYHSAGLLGSG